MSELEEKLNSILSDPEEMEKLMGMAKRLSGQMQKSESDVSSFSDALDPKMLELAGKFISVYQKSKDKTDLIEAVKPYLRQKRHDDIDRAAKIARLAGAARVAFAELSGNKNV